MNTVKHLFVSIAGILILAALAIGCFLLLRVLWNAFAALNPQLGAALVAGFFTITVSISAVVLGRYLEKVKEVEAAYRDRRLKVYEEFVDRFYALTSSEKSVEEHQKDFTNFLCDFNKKILLWVGSRTVRNYAEMMKKISINPTAASSVFSMEDFYKAMRKDLGLENQSLRRGDLLALILRSNDLQQLLNLSRTNPDITLQDLSKKNVT